MGVKLAVVLVVLTASVEAGFHGTGSQRARMLPCGGKNCDQLCSNKTGIPQCTCKVGFSLQPDGISCKDLDECALFSSVCQHACVNSPGSYRCVCRAGYRLDINKHTCSREHEIFDTRTHRMIQRNRFHGKENSSMFKSRQRYPGARKTISRNPSSRQRLNFNRESNNKRTFIPPNRNIRTYSQRSKHHSGYLKDITPSQGQRSNVDHGPRQENKRSWSLFVRNRNLNKRQFWSVFPHEEDYLVSFTDLPKIGDRPHASGKQSPVYRQEVKSTDHVSQSGTREMKRNSGKLDIGFKLNNNRKQQSKQIFNGGYLSNHHDAKFQGKTFLKFMKVGSKLGQNDELMQRDGDGEWTCRGDLCNQKNRLSSLTTTTPSNLVDPSKIKCPEGYHRGLFDGIVVCRPLRASVLKELMAKVCPPGEKAVMGETGVECAVDEDSITCAPGQVLIDTRDGKRCQEQTTPAPPSCSPSQRLMSSPDGFRCVDKPTTTTTSTTTTTITTTTTTTTPTTTTMTTPTTTPLTCRDDEDVVVTGFGRMCVLRTTTTTLPPCAVGLRPVRTPIGVVCQYIGPTITLTTKPPLVCKPPQVVIKTRRGETCGLDPRIRLAKVKCPIGQILKEGPKGPRCRRTNKDSLTGLPCPKGLELVRTVKGMECKYRRTTRKTSRISLSGKTGGVCADGKIKTATPGGFQCQDVKVSEIDLLPNCRPEEVVVKMLDGFECIKKSQVNLTCSTGQRMVRIGMGFFCEEERNGHGSSCQIGEIMFVTFNGPACKKLTPATELCDEDKRPVQTDIGIKCLTFSVRLNCPPGYGLSTDEGRLSVDPEPTEHYPSPDMEGHKLPLASESNCICLTDPCPGPTEVSPCPTGYGVVNTLAGVRCQLEVFEEVLCEADTCRTDTVENCKLEHTDRHLRRSCRDLRRGFLSGCSPQCANGGTCRNGSCVCPPGVIGKTCQEDVDECLDLPEGFCEFRCRNTFGHFECECPVGTTLNTDRRTCSELRCVPGCLNGGMCRDGRCVCPPGFTGDVCESDLDECSSRPGLCEVYCRNTYGSYACVCPPGSRLDSDGRSCINTTCEPECRNGGRCVDGQCVCPPQFKGLVCQLDVNECLRGLHRCSYKCENRYGGFTCVCPPGQTLQRDRRTCRASDIL